MLLVGDAAVELVAVALFFLQYLVAPGFEIGEAAVETAGDPAVEPHRRLRQGLEETAVMADEDDGRAQPLQRPLQRLDADQVEMVGGLVEKEDVGLGSEHAGKGGAARLTAGEPRRVLVATEAKLLDHEAGAIRIIARGQPRLDKGERGGKAREVRLLRQVADRHRWLAEALTAVEGDDARPRS